MWKQSDIAFQTGVHGIQGDAWERMGRGKERGSKEGGGEGRRKGGGVRPLLHMLCRACLVWHSEAANDM